MATDMWPAYLKSLKQALPQADVVHDRFHMAQHLDEAVDKAEHRALLGEDLLKGTKYERLQRHPDLQRSESAVFRLLHHISLKTSRACFYKESFDGFWQHRLFGPKTGMPSAIRSRLQPIKAMARVLKSHGAKLLNYISHYISNAVSEGHNSTIQFIKAIARGLSSI